MRGPVWQRTAVMQHGITAPGQHRDRCQHSSGAYPTLLVQYSHQGRGPEVHQPRLEMTLPGRGIRGLARVLHISPTTVIEACNKSASAPPCPRTRQPPQGATPASCCAPASDRSGSRREVACRGAAQPTTLALAGDCSSTGRGLGVWRGAPARRRLRPVHIMVGTAGHAPCRYGRGRRLDASPRAPTP